jgi:hypothetical protein
MSKLKFSGNGKSPVCFFRTSSVPPQPQPLQVVIVCHKYLSLSTSYEESLYVLADFVQLFSSIPVEYAGVSFSYHAGLCK